MSSNPKINLTVTLDSQAESKEIRIPTALYAGLGCIDTVAGENITFTKLYFANNIKHFKGTNLFAAEPKREVYFDGTAEDWLNITFDSPECNPLFSGGNLYFKNPKTNKYDLVTQFVLADASHSAEGTAIQVPAYSLYGCLSLKKLVLVNEVGLESIGEQAFYNCKNLEEVYLDRPAAGESISFGDMAFANEDWVDFATSTSGQGSTETSPFWGGALPKDRHDGIEAVYFNGTIQEWCSSQFGTVTEDASTRNTTTANPLHSGSYLYLKSGLGYDRQTDLVVPQLPDNAPIARASLIGLRINSLDLSAVNVFGAAGLLTNCTVQKLILPCLESNTATPTHLGYFFTDIELQKSFEGDIQKLSKALIALIPPTLQEVTIKGGRVGGIALKTSSTPQTLEIAQAIQGFVGCEYLKTICFDSGVAAIAKGATCGCKSLESLTINSLRQAENYQLGDIFGTCDQLNALLVLDRAILLPTDADKAYIATYFGEIEQGYPKTLKFRMGGENAYNTGCTTFLPKTLKTCTVLQDRVSPGAFAGCTQLENILLKNVTVIGAWAFFNCTGITSIKIPDSTRRIGSSVFAGCDNLKALDLPFCGGRLFENAFEITPNRDYHALLPSPESLNPNNINDATVKEAKDKELGGSSDTEYAEQVEAWIGAQDLFERLELADLSQENVPEFKLYYDGTIRGGGDYGILGIPLTSAKYYYLSLDHILPYLFEHIYDESQELEGGLKVEELEKPAVLDSNYYCTLARVCKPFWYSPRGLHYNDVKNDWYYVTSYTYTDPETETETTISYAKYQKFSGSMIAYIPTSLSSLTIRQGALQREAFAGFTSLKTLILGAGVQDIALIGEEELKQQNYSGQVAVLDEVQFAYGQRLPDLPSRLLGFPWQDCHELTTIQVDAKNRKYFASGTYLCERTLRDKVMLLMAAESGIAQNSGILDISDSVDGITPAAFYKHATLKHFIGNKLEGIPKACFFYCQSLQSIEALNLSYCKEFAFNGCTELIKISLKENPSVVYQPHTDSEVYFESYPSALPSKNQFIGSFQNSAKLTEVDAPMWAILYCDVQNIETLRISCGPTIEIKDFVTLRLEEQISYSGTYELSYLTPPEFLKLKKLIIGSDVQYIADRAFCSIQIPTQYPEDEEPEDAHIVKSSGHLLPVLEQIIIEDRSPNCNHYNSGLVGHVAFSGCPTIKELIIGEGIETIGASSFAHATQLEKVSLPTTLTVIGNRAFENCINLLEITCPKGLLGIGDTAFKNCLKLKTVNFNRCLKFIGEYAFANTDLQSLELILDEPTNFTWGELDYLIVNPETLEKGDGSFGLSLSQAKPELLQAIPWDPNSVGAFVMQCKYTYLSSWVNYAKGNTTYACFRNLLTHDVPSALVGTQTDSDIGQPSSDSNDTLFVTSVDSIDEGQYQHISWRRPELVQEAHAETWPYRFRANVGKETNDGEETIEDNTLEFNKSEQFLMYGGERVCAYRADLQLRTLIQPLAFANTPLKKVRVIAALSNQPALICDQAFAGCMDVQQLILDCEGMGFVRPATDRDLIEKPALKDRYSWQTCEVQYDWEIKHQVKPQGLINGGLTAGSLVLGSSVKSLGTLCFRSGGMFELDLRSAYSLKELPAGCFQACMNLTTVKLSSSIQKLTAYYARIAPKEADYLEFLGNPFSGCENLQAVYGLEPTDTWMYQPIPQMDPNDEDYPKEDPPSKKWNIFKVSNPHLKLAEELKNTYKYSYFQQ